MPDRSGRTTRIALASTVATSARLLPRTWTGIGRLTGPAKGLAAEVAAAALAVLALRRRRRAGRLSPSQAIAQLRTDLDTAALATLERLIGPAAARDVGHPHDR